MDERIRYYSIHNFVKFKIVDRSKFFESMFSMVNIEYENFEVENIDDVDFTIYLGTFIPNNSDCKILDNKYYIKDGYIYARESHKSASWEFEIEDLDSADTKVRISFNSAASMIIPDYVINLIIFSKLNEKGYSIIHGAGISRDGSGYVFSGQGGCGKTTTALYSLENGYKFLGDNFLILHKDRVYSYLSPLNIFSFNFLTSLKKSLGRLKKVEYHVKAVLSKTTGITIVTKVNPKLVFPRSVGSQSGLTKLFVVLPNNDWKAQKISKQDAKRYLVSNVKLDFVSMTKYFSMYGFVFPESAFGRFWEIYESNLDSNLSEGLCYYNVEVPQKYTQKTFDRFVGLIQDE